MCTLQPPPFIFGYFFASLLMSPFARLDDPVLIPYDVSIFLYSFTLWRADHSDRSPKITPIKLLSWFARPSCITPILISMVSFSSLSSSSKSYVSLFPRLPF